MNIRMRTLAGLLVVGGASAAIAIAPAAAADPLLPQCEATGGSAVIGGQTTDCASPGNVQIDATPPQPNGGFGYFPWDDEFWVL